ncbi:TrmH family RNA methyltransferase [Solitalea koreensis]|uniref:RNA methyltransferase, TrmH family n=1 Tax=Solitalea koreensis TaxID=543615 RepID=A0A521CPA6_9SPHI|nr:RNA methyltransferase [Solitalea koreensis]SMO60581.1 RNA methyltransferase, TrmH family [Solitalea koreensis]
MIDLISSTHNPKIKNVLKLQEKSSERRNQNLIVFEGNRELGLAISAGFKIRTLFVCPEIWGDEKIEGVAQRDIFYISKDVFDKIAYREGSDGLVIVAEPKYLSLDTLVLNKTPFLIILEAVEKPGNLGAILRTADAAQVDAVIVCDPKTDIYNPNAIRSSVGCAFTTQIVASTSEEVLHWLKTKNIKSYAAALTAKEFYHETDLASACAIVMGTEATGLSEKWLNEADQQIKIPMRGQIDSLNVSTSTAILAFEAMRQRGFHND